MSEKKRIAMLKRNLMSLVSDHRAKCVEASCNVSLDLVRELAERAGISFTPAEVLRFE